MSIVGIFCGGLLSIVGIVMGFQAKQGLEQAGRKDTGKATAAIVVGIISLIPGVGSTIYKVTHH